EELTVDNVPEILKNLNGILVAPGFGERGIEGKIEAVKFARENDIPFFGICLGMQMAVIEYSRNVLGLKGANSTEMNNNTLHPVIDLMEEQKNITDYGGTMRLGAWDCILKDDSKVRNIYRKEHISERHRHRYEFNNDFLEQIENAGMIATGKNPKTNLVEVIEIPKHPWFVGVQYHPEYKSTVLNPHPLFVDFVKAALNHSLNRPTNH
ncbi:MAG: glutamine amidotransferase-related protein, partial [Lutibacter sp.]